MGADLMTLATFLKQIAVGVSEQNVSLPLRDQSAWHKLLYELKQSDAPGKPAFLNELWFDWDGPLPEAPDVTDFLARLHWNGSISADNPRYEVATLPEPVCQLWRDQAPAIQGDEAAFLVKAVDQAARQFRKAA
jgi:hypothetical protein